MHIDLGGVGRIQRITGYRLTAQYYARIEWGLRAPSADALDKIAEGLELNQAQREYAFSLIHEKSPPVTFHGAVPDSVRRVVQLQQSMSAHLVDRRMSARLRDWEIHARTIVALCRSLWARERSEEIRLILQRMLAFPQFATWWNQPQVSTEYFRKQIDHPDVGLLILEQTVHQVLACRDLYMVLLAPLPECETEDKLRMLLTLRAQRRADRPRSARQPAAGDAVSDGMPSTSGERATPAVPPCADTAAPATAAGAVSPELALAQAPACR